LGIIGAQIIQVAFPAAKFPVFFILITWFSVKNRKIFLVLKIEVVIFYMMYNLPLTCTIYLCFGGKPTKNIFA